ncbi:Neural-cadherin [Penaeus vannamei]|uniref:Neural-cadherin n=1 Tax=Penaeus vannamei TaxID=6689 RepID=A0A3R7PEK9_PENVA|nr:Neural-cadherin [Penaeus vannamei]
MTQREWHVKRGNGRDLNAEWKTPPHNHRDDKDKQNGDMKARFTTNSPYQPMFKCCYRPRAKRPSGGHDGRRPRQGTRACVGGNEPPRRTHGLPAHSGDPRAADSRYVLPCSSSVLVLFSSGVVWARVPLGATGGLVKAAENEGFAVWKGDEELHFTPHFLLFRFATEHDKFVIAGHPLRHRPRRPPCGPPPTGPHHHRFRHHHDRRLKRRNLDNRHEPRFTHSEYQQRNASYGFCWVHAIDDDMDRNGLIKYSVSDPEHFFVDEGGVLYNIKPLDFEHTNGKYVLQVTAEDQAPTRSSRKKATAPVTIRIIDKPDPPEFDSTEYKFSVSEFASTDAYVGTVVARDEDGDFDRYALENVDPEGMFLVDEKTGIIRVGRTNFANKWEFNFQAVAFDLGKQSSRVPVTVEIIDENTNKPVFKECSNYDQKSIQENMEAGSSVLIVIATDDDHGVNGEVEYSFRNDYDSFAIETKLGQGYISTTQPLDRDDGEKEYYMTVIARDKAPTDWLLGACSFRIVVEDVNDNPPIFDQATYMYKLPTDKAVGTEILRVTATDKDAGLNADVVYELEGEATDLAYFEVDPDTGVIVLKKELNENMADQKTFSLTARAQDKGTPPMACARDCDWTWWPRGSSRPPSSARAPSPRAWPRTRRRTPKCSTLHLLPFLPFTISPLLSAFYSSLASPAFALTESLPPPFLLPFLLPSSPLSPPFLPFLPRFHLPSFPLPPPFLPPSSLVAHPRLPRSSNIPGRPKVYFALLNGNTRDTNDDGSFDVRPLEDGDNRCPADTNGASIYVALRNLDYEAITSYKLILQLVNEENSRHDEQILVEILDVNDNPPLLQPYDGAVVENAEPALITTIQAVDKDATEAFRNLDFSFDEESVTQDVKDKFRLRTNGELSTLMKLDRENASQYRVPVIVTDGEPSHVRRRTYWITVQDVNDEPPRFDVSSVVEVELPERTEVGKDTGIKLVVLDPDVVNYNEFQIVEGNQYQKFRIDPTTGDVLVNQLLDYDAPTNDRNVRNHLWEIECFFSSSSSSSISSFSPLLYLFFLLLPSFSSIFSVTNFLISPSFLYLLLPLYLQHYHLPFCLFFLLPHSFSPTTSPSSYLLLPFPPLPLLPHFVLLPSSHSSPPSSLTSLLPPLLPLPPPLLL